VANTLPELEVGGKEKM
jgi:hypothetical protein